MEKVAASSGVTKVAQPCSPRDIEAHKAHRRIVPLAAFNPFLHLSSFKTISVFMCIRVCICLCMRAVCVIIHVSQHGCGGQRAASRYQFFPTVKLLELDPKSLFWATFIY